MKNENKDVNKQSTKEQTKPSTEWYGIAMVIFIVILVLGLAYCIVLSIIMRTVEYATIVSIVLNTIVAGLGFYAIWANIQNDKEIKRYEFIADYNHNFLTNAEFINVERMLESCNQKYEIIKNRIGKNKWGNKEKEEFKAYCDKIFGTKDFMYSDNEEDSNSRLDENGWIREDYQKIVNYLVYLESFVPLILNRQLEYKDVDDLFGYRYFIAMNNPVIQMNELLRESEYYRGCIETYKGWWDYRNNPKRKFPIPMEEYDLYKQRNEYVSKEQQIL